MNGEVRVPITLSNATTMPLTFAVTTTDFGAIDSTGGVAFYGKNSSAKYGLADSTTLSVSELTIAPQQKGTVTALVKNTSNLQQGGHYGAVLFSLKDSNISGQVAIRQTVASLLFIVKKGGSEAHLTMAKVALDQPWLRLPRDLTLSVSNFGNVHAVPSGNVRLLDPFGRVVETTPLNTANGKVLPETTRNFVLGIHTVAAVYPGFYTLQARTNAGSFERTFLVIPSLSVWVCGIVVVLVSVGMYVRRRRKVLPAEAPIFQLSQQENTVDTKVEPLSIMAPQTDYNSQYQSSGVPVSETTPVLLSGAVEYGTTAKSKRAPSSKKPKKANKVGKKVIKLRHSKTAPELHSRTPHVSSRSKLTKKAPKPRLSRK